MNAISLTLVIRKLTLNTIYMYIYIYIALESWKNYDLALAMLKSYKRDEFKSLGPLSESVSEPPVFACRSCRLPNYKHLLALANEDGKIGIQDTSSTRKESTSSNINCKYR